MSRTSCVRKRVNKLVCDGTFLKTFTLIPGFGQLEFYPSNRVARTVLIYSGNFHLLKETDQRFLLVQSNSRVPPKLKWYTLKTSTSFGSPPLTPVRGPPLLSGFDCRSFPCSWSQDVGVPCLKTVVRLSLTFGSGGLILCH